MPDYTPETMRENERMDRGQPCPHCGQDLRPDAFEQFATSQQRMEALEADGLTLARFVREHMESKHNNPAEWGEWNAARRATLRLLAALAPEKE